MGPEKTTVMVLKVDLDCDRCYQKVKRTLCRFPQVRDQMYNDKENTVMIKVVCCSPEKIRDKICAKGGRSIKGIQIVEPKPPPPPAGAKPSKPAPAPPAGGDSAPPPAEKPKDKAAAPPADKPKDKAPPPAEKPKDKPQGPPPSDKIQKNGSKNGSGPKPDQQGKPPEKQAQAAPAKPDSKPPAPAPAPQQLMPPQAMMQSMQMGVPGYPPPPGIYPVNMHWGPFYDGGMYPPPPPQPVHMMGDPYGYYGSGSGGWNSRPPTGYCSNRSDYFSDENPQACVVM